MIKQLFESMWDAGRDTMKSLPAGAMRAYGAEPINKVGGVTTFGFANKAFDLADGSLMPTRNAGMDFSAAERVGLGSTAFGLGSQLLAGGIGGITGGFGGMASGMLTDIAIDAAIVKYAYSPAKAAANVTTVKGAIRGPGMLKSFGLYGAGAAGSMIGGAIGGATGIPGLEMAGTLVGAGAGVKYAGAMGRAGGVGLLAAAGVGAAAAVGYGGYQMLKMGYDHKQRQKMIQTSGSMVSFNTQGAHTMRARAVQAIHKNHLNTRSALGQEASYLHYPSRSYNSRYRR